MTYPNGSYMLLEVPNSETGLTNSFLRLGAATPAYALQPGAELAQKFPVESEFFDDRRKRDGGPDFRPESDRIADTAGLLSRGGWWDHAGGNRITTTEGDKLEVIRGNYRLAVLGRQLDGEEGWGESAGFDFSGGIIRDKQRLPGEIYSVEWRPTWGGTWWVWEKTEKGDLHTIFWGNKVSQSYGDTFDETIGSDDPGDEEPNPDITSRTWANTIEVKTGSASKAVSSSKEETWAEDIKGNTFTLAKSGSTQALTIEEATHAGSITESSAFLWKKTLTVGAAKNEISLIASVTELAVLGHKSTVSVGATALDVEVIPAKLGVSLGAKTSLRLGDSIDVSVGDSVGVQLGSKLNVAVRPVSVAVEIAPVSFDLFLGIALAINLIKIEVGPDIEEVHLAEDGFFANFLIG